MGARRELPLLALAHAIFSSFVQASMSITHAMPSNANDECFVGICGQGSLMTESLVKYSMGNSIAFVNGEDIEIAPGWPAGEVSYEEVNNIYTYNDSICTANLRGVTLLRVLRSFVESKHLPGVSSGHHDQVLQYSGLRLTYSTTLPSENRLLKVELWKEEGGGGSGAYVPFDRTAIYGVTLLKFDKDEAYPYRKMWSAPSLDGEYVSCDAKEQSIGPLIADFLTANSPYTIPAPESRLLSEAGGTAIVVDQDGPYCFGIGEMYDPAVYSCVPCPPNEQPVADGLSCEGATAPATPAPATPAPATPSPATPAPATPAPATPAPATAAPATPAPDTPAPTAWVPSTPPATPVPGTSASGSTSAPSGSANPTVAPAPAPGSQGGATAAAGNASSAPLGLIIGAVVGSLALIAIVVGVAVVIRRRSASRRWGEEKLLDSRLTPVEDPLPHRDTTEEELL